MRSSAVRFQRDGVADRRCGDALLHDFRREDIDLTAQHFANFDIETADPDQLTVRVVRHEVHHDVDVTTGTGLAPSDRAEEPRVGRPVLGEEGVELVAVRVEELAQGEGRRRGDAHASRVR